MSRPIDDPTDKRKYRRLKSVVPVDFSIVRLHGDVLGLDWEKGHTENVSEGGLCLETERVNEATINFISKENIYLDLRLHLPIALKPLKAIAEVAWYQKKQAATQYVIGLKFKSIPRENLKKLLAYARYAPVINRTVVVACAAAILGSLWVLLLFLKEFGVMF